MESNKVYHSVYTTSKFVVTFTRDNNIVDVLIYGKTGENFTQLASSTYECVSDRQALRLTRVIFCL